MDESDYSRVICEAQARHCTASVLEAGSRTPNLGPEAVQKASVFFGFVVFVLRGETTSKKTPISTMWLKARLATAPAKWRFVNARPDPDFRYCSKRSTFDSVGDSIDTTIDHGRCDVV